jgi:hypothetical protein
LTLFYSQENLILFFDIEYGRKRVGVGSSFGKAKTKLATKSHPKQHDMGWDGWGFEIS